MTIRDQIKKIAAEVYLAQGSPPKYRMGTVSQMNSDGTCNIMIDGASVQAAPLFPMVKGEQVVVMRGSDGSWTASPIRAHAPIVPFEHPPFFTGGGFRVAAVVNALANGGTPPLGSRDGDLMIQESGNSKVFLVPSGAVNAFVAPFGGNASNLIDWSFSPDGQYVAFLWADLSNTVNNYSVGVYQIGKARLSSTVQIGAPNLNLWKIAPTVITPNVIFPYTAEEINASQQYFAINDVFSISNACLKVDDSGNVLIIIPFLLNPVHVGFHIYSILAGASSATTVQTVTYPLGTLLISKIGQFWGNDDGFTRLYDGYKFVNAVTGFENQITDFSTFTVFAAGGDFTNQPNPATSVCTSKGFAASGFRVSSAAGDYALWSQKKGSSVVVTTTLAGFIAGFGSTGHKKSIENRFFFSQGAFLGFFPILLTASNGNWVLDSNFGVDPRGRMYPLTGTIGGTLTHGLTPFPNFSPGTTDPSVIRLMNDIIFPVDPIATIQDGNLGFCAFGE
jgi:hypothetical protein